MNLPEFCSLITHSIASKLKMSLLESCLNLIALTSKTTRTDGGMDVLKDTGDRADFLLDKAENNWFCFLVFEDE